MLFRQVVRAPITRARTQTYTRKHTHTSRVRVHFIRPPTHIAPITFLRAAVGRCRSVAVVFRVNQSTRELEVLLESSADSASGWTFPNGAADRKGDGHMDFIGGPLRLLEERFGSGWFPCVFFLQPFEMNVQYTLMIKCTHAYI